MKDPSDRTKVVVRHLPPAISQSAVMEQIDGSFAGRYDWARFRPGKVSNRNQRYSRVYLNFKRPEDVVEFAEFFDGHIFVNEKGAQFKSQVEYAPSQLVPKPWSKKDGREGSITKDPEYMEFLEIISKPTEHLPSAEIQLERKEAERAGAAKETVIVTPLMDFVRQKRAAKSGQRSSARLSRKTIGPSAITPSPSKRGLKPRASTSMYILKDGKGGNPKDKLTYILVPRREGQHALADKPGLASLAGKEAPQNELGGRSRIVLLKGKEKEVSDTSGGVSQQQIVTSSVRNLPTSISKHNPRLEVSGKIIRSILSKESRSSQLPATSSIKSELGHTVNVDRDKHPPRPPNSRSSSKDHMSSSSSLASTISDVDDKRYTDDKISASHAHGSGPNSDKHDKRPRNKDRPDRSVIWALRRTDRSQYNDGALSSTSESTQFAASSLDHVSTSHHLAAKLGENDVVNHSTSLSRNTSSPEGSYEMVVGQGERKHDIHLTSRNDDLKGAGRVSIIAVENGSHRHVGRRGQARGMKEVDSSLTVSEGKFLKRGSNAYGSHERQVWIQKSGSAS